MSKTNFIVTLFNIRQELKKELISIFYIWLIIELGTKILPTLKLWRLFRSSVPKVSPNYLNFMICSLFAASIFKVVPTGCCSVRDDFMIRKSHHCFPYFR